MKEKDGSNTEDILAQLSNTRTSETVLKSLYPKLSGVTLSNVQRIRLLKLVILHVSKDGCSIDLQSIALESGLSIVKADSSTNPASGAIFNFFEVCCKLVKDYVIKPSDQAIDAVALALKVLSCMNAMTASKMFSNKGDDIFLSNLILCLKKDKLKLPTLSLLAVCLSEPTSKTFVKDEISFVQAIYPLLFNLEDSNIRSTALSVMLKTTIKSKVQPFWNQLKEDTQREYCKHMVEMVNQKLNWPEVWQFVVKMFGEELHSGGQLINHMLEVLERAFKHSDFEWTRVQAFVCWNTLIDNFKSGLKNKKRIDLIMIPLKANNHRIEILASAKLNTYNHLFTSLGKDLITYPDVLSSFFAFCFGSEKVTCPPVKSYTSLHEDCVNSISKVFSSPFIKEVFNKIHKELIQAVGDCFMLENVKSELLTTLWDSLMSLVQQQEGTDVVKELFNVVNSLVNKAATGETSANFKMRRSISPPGSPLGPRPVNKDLGRRIVLIILHSIVHGKSALPTNMFRNSTLYIGSFDVMNGTPPLLFIEWLFSPALKLGAANTKVYKQLLSKIISLKRDESAQFMEFTQQVLKKLLVIDESFPSDIKILFYKYAADNWCTLVDEIVLYIQNQGSINQGDAAEHDFRALYSVLMFPVQYLSVDFELVKVCSLPWKNLFYESCQQAALLATASIQHLCEEICIRLVVFSKRNTSPLQHASIFFFFTNILNVVHGRFSSVKRAKWVQEHISGVVKELNHLSFDEEMVFSQAAICIDHCLQHSSVTKEVVINLNPILCSLLNVKISTPDRIDDLCSALGSLKQASITIHQHGVHKETVSTMLKNVILAGKNHVNQKIKASITQLSNFSEEKMSPEKEKSLYLVNGSTLANCASPKSFSKKLPTIQMSPSNLSPGNSKRKVQVISCAPDGKFVRIETPPKKIILTEHQKEVRRERRQDIPALYQDLSQASQSMTQDVTQDVIPLSTSPKKRPNGITLDEDAVMDTGDVDTNIQVLYSKTIDSPASSKKVKMECESNLDVPSFTPPAGFVLPLTTGDTTSKSESKGNSSESTATKIEEYTGKENEDSSIASKAEKLMKKTTRANTRSSTSTNLTTRSGKIVTRTSLSLTSEPDLLKKKRSARKSLPVHSSEEILKKNSVENLESDTTDTESISSNTSDASGSGIKSAKMQGVHKRRSLKRELSLELSADSEKNANGPKNTAVTADEKKEKNGKVSPLEKSKKNSQDLSQKKVGGKVLTRSRSNSSLDDLVNTSSVKLVKEDVSTDSSIRPMSPIVESNLMLERSQDESCRFPKHNGVDLVAQQNDVIPEDETSAGASRITRKVVKSCASPVPNLSAKSISPQISKPVIIKNEKVSDTSNGTVNKQKDSPKLCETIKQSDVIEVGADCTLEEHGVLDSSSQESQEIIESSQEPMSKMKQCVVSLELFRCAEPNEKRELEDVIVKSGPDSCSPFKVLPKSVDEISPTTQKLVCRSLNMDGDMDDSVPLSALKMKTSTVAENTVMSPEKDLKSTLSSSHETSEPHVSPKKASVSGAIVKGSPKKAYQSENEKNQESASVAESLPPSWNSSMPEWMHEKKSSPSSKTLRIVRTPTSRSQAFLKSVSPPKPTDMSPISSPVQPKRIQKTELQSNTTPIINRSSRAAQLLGLGQAAAARGGETVVSNGNRSNRSEAEENEVIVSASTSTSSGTCVVSNTMATSVVNASVTTVSVVASPSVRRQGRLLEMATPQKSLEDEGLKKDWIRKTPCATATPDTSILKRKREVDSDAPSPSLKRKRVSFRDPPLSSLLRFNETAETPGTVFSSDPSDNLDMAAEILPIDQDQEISKTVVEIEAEVQSTQKATDTCSATNESSSSTNLDIPIEATIPSGIGSKKRKASGNDECNDNLKDRPVISTRVSSSDNGTHMLRSASPDKRDHDNQRNSKKSSKSVSAPRENFQTPEIENEESSDSDEMEVDEDAQNQGECLETNSEQLEAGTEGMLDDLPHLPSGLSPVYQNLLDCTHPVECISSKLTTPVWKKSLLREFSEQGIHTVGDLAKLTQERLDRLSVKPPKRTNVCSVLEDFEKRHAHSGSHLICGSSKDVITPFDQPGHSLKDALATASDEEIITKLTELGRMPKFCPLVIKASEPHDVAENIAKIKNVLQALPVDTVAEMYLSQVGKSSGRVEKNVSVEGLALILSRVQAGVLQDTIFPAVPSILSSVHSDAMRNYVLREFSPSEIVQQMDNDKMYQLLDAISARLGTGEFASKVLSKLNEKEIAQHLDESHIERTVKALLSKLDFRQSLKFLFDHGQDILKEPNNK
ncbi:hypothetical protein FOCC_FOCC008908 [Frankliniella occidentalis]|uniref:Telomere-associated protein RIF1 isoform X1 n=1 Tax=Frankliniella occidentalis TaxID=133901 RepID=A0A9C6X0M0_FRAOC|nr:telomere-associated protein RIF1 isoform X1 [Frankliniella occidentalis]XP_052125704.1 telomere-associated protein RIF1 isoform X1 [Frankliniella occidentalis]XP_052125705.1 telomere-associated protein RIF1 isoform X1 [Frankliniella occidentalis]KAE8744433.1 hypothetical protein FOCC_FOCC008908 [Frankliniella occidentalis]